MYLHMYLQITLFIQKHAICIMYMKNWCMQRKSGNFSHICLKTYLCYYLNNPKGLGVIYNARLLKQLGSMLLGLGCIPKLYRYLILNRLSVWMRNCFESKIIILTSRQMRGIKYKPKHSQNQQMQLFHNNTTHLTVLVTFNSIYSVT